MPQLAHIALVVRDYEEALAFYVDKLGFELVGDTYQPAQDKRWVMICPPGEFNNETCSSTRPAPALHPRPGPDTPDDAPP